MCGCWAGERGGERFHERWTQADPSTLLAVSHTVKAGRMTAFEFLRVVVKDGRAVYVAQPGGVAADGVRRVEPDRRADRLREPRARLPEARDLRAAGPDRLTAAIDGGAAGSQRAEFAMAREPCGRWSGCKVRRRASVRPRTAGVVTSGRSSR